MQEYDYSEHGVLLEMGFRDFLEDRAGDLPGVNIVRIPHSGKGREDPSFDVILQFDYTYYFDVVGTYSDENGYRLYTGKKDFYKLLDQVEQGWSVREEETGRRYWFDPGLSYLAFQLKTGDHNVSRWYCLEIKQDSYFIDYNSDLRVSKELVREAIALEDSFSYVHARYKTIPLFKDRELWFNQDLEYQKREVVLKPSIVRRKRKKKVNHDMARHIQEWLEFERSY